MSGGFFFFVLTRQGKATVEFVHLNIYIDIFNTWGEGGSPHPRTFLKNSAPALLLSFLFLPGTKQVHDS